MDHKTIMAVADATRELKSLHENMSRWRASMKRQLSELEDGIYDVNLAIIRLEDFLPDEVKEIHAVLEIDDAGIVTEALNGK